MPASLENPTPDGTRSTRRATWVVGIFVLLTLASALYGAGVKPLLKAGGLIALNSESTDAKKWLHEGLDVSSPDVVAIFTSDELERPRHRVTTTRSSPCSRPSPRTRRSSR